jgi:hypothetical protein
MNDLQSLLSRPGLERQVVRLRLDMTVSLSERHEIDRILRDLRGTDATHGRVGVLLEASSSLRVRIGSDNSFPEDLPPVLKDAVARLQGLAASAVDESEKQRATRALSHLYNLVSHE